jgi:CRP-like cAMP-binding protein
MRHRERGLLARQRNQETILASTSVRSGNRLLDCLIQKEGSLEEDVDVTHFEAGHQFYEPGASISAVFFPMGSVVSLMVSLADGQKAEVATVGREGMVGVDALLRTKHSPVLAVQQIDGDVAHIGVSRLQRAMRSSERLLSVVSCYVAYALRAAHQSTACNALHRLEARTARWLLMTADRTGEPSFTLTQQMLAEMLGVGRQSVNEIASRLQRTNLIEYRRGHVTILQRERLEKVACECYAKLRAHYEELLG